MFSRNKHPKLRRGSKILFYLKKKGVIWGEATICSYEEIRSEGAFEKYKNLIPFSKQKIEEISNNLSKLKMHPDLREEPELTALHIIWKKEYKNKLHLPEIPDVDRAAIKKKVYRLYSIDYKNLKLIREKGNGK